MPIGAKHRNGLRGEHRAKRTPPHVPLKALRIVARITLDQLADELAELLDERPTRGTLSAIESGSRGASTELISAIEQVYGLDAGTVTTSYRPRQKSAPAA